MLKFAHISHKTIVTSIRFNIGLNFIRNNFNKDKNLIIHHGLMGSSKNFRSVSKNPSISAYANSYLIDCRNHGQSPHTETHTIKELAEDLKQFIQNVLFKNEKHRNIYLLGHSMGGMAVMQFSKMFPQMQEYVKRIIIVDIPCRPLQSNPSKPKTFNQTGDMLRKISQIDLKSKTTAQIYNQIDKVAISKDIAGLIKSDLKAEGERKHSWKPNLSVIVKYYNQIGQFDVMEPKGQLQWKGPVNLIYGSQSRYMSENNVADFLKAYPQMRVDQNFYRVQGSGHWVHFEKTQKFLEIMNKILRQ